MSQEIEQLKNKVGGIDTFYLKSGKGDPIVFLHGIPGASFLWRNVIKNLAVKYSCFAPDLPGFSESDNPQSFSLGSYGQWLKQFCEHISSGQKVNLVVHDVGGPIGLSFALQNKNMINKLIIMDTLIGTSHLPLATRVSISPITLWIYYNLTTKGMLYWLMRNVSVNQSEKLKNETIDKYYRVYLRDKRERNSSKLIHGLKADIDALVEQKLPEIDIPTLILWSEKDKAVPIVISEFIKSKIANSKLETLPNCGHFSQEEEPEIITQKIAGFLK